MRHIPFAHVHDHQFGHAATATRGRRTVHSRLRALLSWHGWRLVAAGGHWALAAFVVWWLNR